jgi:hypothetical protein
MSFFRKRDRNKSVDHIDNAIIPDESAENEVRKKVTDEIIRLKGIASSADSLEAAERLQAASDRFSDLKFSCTEEALKGIEGFLMETLNSIAQSLSSPDDPCVLDEKLVFLMNQIDRLSEADYQMLFESSKVASVAVDILSNWIKLRLIEQQKDRIRSGAKAIKREFDAGKIRSEVAMQRLALLKGNLQALEEQEQQMRRVIEFCEANMEGNRL